MRWSNRSRGPVLPVRNTAGGAGNRSWKEVRGQYSSGTSPLTKMKILLGLSISLFLFVTAVFYSTSEGEGETIAVNFENNDRLPKVQYIPGVGREEGEIVEDQVGGGLPNSVDVGPFQEEDAIEVTIPLEANSVESLPSQSEPLPSRADSPRKDSYAEARAEERRKKEKEAVEDETIPKVTARKYGESIKKGRKHVLHNLRLNDDELEVEESGGKGRSGLMKSRMDEVREAMLHAWNGYSTKAFGHDEVHPITEEPNDSWGGFGITLTDALDTLALMGLHVELQQARAHVASINWNKNYDVSFFETTIRHLGGLLGAYELTKDALYLRKAVELGNRLYASFQSPTGIPYSIVNLQTGKVRNPKWTGEHSILSEVGTVQLEFKALSHYSGDTKYSDASHRVMKALADMPRKHGGLFPVYIDNQRGSFESGLATYGGLSDSFYEYLLKQHIQSGWKDPLTLSLYSKATHDLRKFLVHTTHAPIFNSTQSHVHFYVGALEGEMAKHSMEHLVCFVPGMLALGHHHGVGYQPPAEEEELLENGDPNVMAMDDLALAKELLHTCTDLYLDQPTGLGPERVLFHVSNEVEEHQKKENAMNEWYSVELKGYLLRPETIESLYILHYVTGEEEYQEIGWQIFRSINKFCKTKAAYSGLLDVTRTPVAHDNSMQSFFFAETLKYLYLLFAPNDILNLKERVLTTEGHILPIH